MKLVYQSSSFIPSLAANSIHVVNMSEQFSEKGVETLLLGYKGDDELCSDVYDYYGVSKSFSIKLLKNSSFFNRLFYFFWSLYMAFSFKADLVVSRNFYGVMLFSLCGFKVIYDIHSPFWGDSLVKSFCWSLIRKSRKLYVTTNSTFLKKELARSDLFPRNGVEVLFNGAKASNCSSHYFEKNSDVLDVGYVGGLYQGRGIDMILELSHKVSDIRFHIAGGTQEQIENLKFKANDNVVFYGHIPPSETDSFRSACDVLLAPYNSSGVYSYGRNSVDQSLYQNPIKLIEYLSSGKAIIASDIPSVRDVFSDDVAILLNPNEIELWSSTLEHLRDNPDVLKKLVYSTEKVFSDKYTWSSRAEKMVNIIN